MRGDKPATCTSRAARDCCRLAWAVRTSVLACRAIVTSSVSCASLKRCHQPARSCTLPAGAPVPVDQPAGVAVSGRAPPSGTRVAQAASRIVVPSAHSSSVRGRASAACDWIGDVGAGGRIGTIGSLCAQRASAGANGIVATVILRRLCPESVFNHQCRCYRNRPSPRKCHRPPSAFRSRCC